MNSNPIARLRFIGVVEGISFLLLVFIAMPLKHLADLPLAVKYLGWAHGVLFMLYCMSLMNAMLVAGWPLTRGIKLFVAALVPFGPFLTHKRLVADEQALRDKSV